MSFKQNIVVFMNSLKNLNIFRKFSKLLIIIGFLYQFYDSIDNYFKYNFVIQFDHKFYYGIIPSMTVCLNQKAEMNKSIYGMSFRGERELFCALIYHNLSYYDCSSKFDLDIYYRDKNNSICLSFFNNFEIASSKFQEAFEPVMRIEYYAQLYWIFEFIIHPRYTPSHFYNSFRTPKHEGFNRFGLIKLKLLTKNLLSAPYSTNCFDYSLNQRNNVWPKSRTDCMLEYMKHKEMKTCGHNYYWNHYLFRNKTFQNLNYTKFETNCTVRADLQVLNRLCLIDCKFEEYLAEEDIQSANFYGSLLIVDKSYDNSLLLDYKPKMTIIQLFSTLGGLVSMWLGISLYQLACSLSKKYRLLIARLSKRIKNFLSSKIRIKFKATCQKMFIAILSITIVYQLLDLLIIFVNSNKIIDIQFEDQIRFPQTRIVFQSRVDLTRLKHFHPEINYTELGIMGNKVPLNSLPRINEHLKEIMTKNITQFKLITQLEENLLKCDLVYENYLINCPKPDTFLYFSPDTNIYFNYQLNANESIVHAKYLKFKRVHISIELLDEPQFYQVLILLSNHIFMNYYPNEISLKRLFYRNNIFFQAQYFRKTAKGCKQQNKSLFNDNISDHLVMDCINYETNLTINCLPINGINYWIRVDRDLKHFGYKLCPINDTIDRQLIDEIIFKCLSKIFKSRDNCETQVFSIFNNIYQASKALSTIDVNIIPKKNLNVVYQEKDRMNWFDLVYECGGIMGMWIGISIMSLPNLAIYLIKYSKYLFKIYLKFYRVMIRIQKRFLILLVRFLNELIKRLKRIVK